jgi:hypothetical protein
MIIARVAFIPIPTLSTDSNMGSWKLFIYMNL